MCQRLKTGESNNFYFGIFICIGPLEMSQLLSLTKRSLLCIQYNVRALYSKTLERCTIEEHQLPSSSHPHGC